MSPRCRGVLPVMWLVFFSPLPYMPVAKFGRASGGRSGGRLPNGGPVALILRGIKGLPYCLSPSFTPLWGTGGVGPRNDPVSSQLGPHIHVLSKLGMASAMANFTLGDVFHVRKSASVRRRATSPTSFAS